MKSKKLLSLLASLLLALLLVSCTGEPADTTLPETLAETEAPATVQDLVLLEGGEFKFKIIRPMNCDESILNGAIALRKALEEVAGTYVDIADDFIKDGQEHDPNTYEILFGLTNYEESVKLHEGLNYGTYRIAARGNKIVIATHDSISASKVSYAFPEYLRELMADGRIVLPGNYSTEVKADNVLSLVPAFAYGTFEASYTGKHQDRAFIYSKTSPEDFNAYLDYASGLGCTVHSSAEMGKNLSATLKNDKAVVSAFYSAADKRTRIIIENEKTTSLPVTEAENKYEKVCDSLFVQLGLEQPYDGGSVFTSAVANYNNGMGYIFRLADGSFILIDGGFNKTLGAKMIYEKLCELALDKDKIVIAAWIMSHQHGDHVGAFRKFTEAYSQRVKVERVIYNMPTSEEAKLVDEGTGNGDMVENYTSKYSDAVSSVAHPGQVHYLRNAKIEVLHTMDLMRPVTELKGGNSTCICVKITIEGQTYLFPGDSYADMTSLLIKHYGDYLKSDFCQVIHHGAPGGSNEFYKAVDPTVVIWPLGTWDYYPWRRYESFHTFLFESANVKEIVLAGHTDRTFTLPYTFPTEKVLPEEIEVTWNYLDGKN